MSTAHGKFIAARTSLILEQPFFGSLALRLKVQADPTCKTAWVDGRTLGYNPAFVDSLSHGELVGLVAHEVLHVALGHPWRRGGREHRKWNIACDKAINTELQTSGFTLPEDAYYSEGDEVGKSAEWIHGHMAEQEPEPKPEPEPQPDEDEQEEEQPDDNGDPGQPGDAGDDEGDDTGDGDGEEGGESDGDGNGEGNSQGPDAGNGQGEVRDAPVGPDADGDEAPSEQEWKEAVATAAALAKSQGELPGGLARVIADALKPRVDVRSLLLRWMQERTASDYSWTRPNVRYLAQGTYLPALHAHRMGEVAIMVDTSGSIDDVALGHAREIVQDVLDECDPSGVSLYFADARVCAVERLERGERLTWEPKGGGGTNFIPALEAIEQDESQPVCCICITDLEGTFPLVAPEVPVLWLATKERDYRGQPLVAPFGETVYVAD
jgi:predicted metal-dependent peptidase